VIGNAAHLGLLPGLRPGWNYSFTPFLFTYPGVGRPEIEPWPWRGRQSLRPGWRCTSRPKWPPHKPGKTGSSTSIPKGFAAAQATIVEINGAAPWLATTTSPIQGLRRVGRGHPPTGCIGAIPQNTVTSMPSITLDIHGTVKLIRREGRTQPDDPCTQSYVRHTSRRRLVVARQTLTKTNGAHPLPETLVPGSGFWRVSFRWRSGRAKLSTWGRTINAAATVLAVLGRNGRQPALDGQLTVGSGTGPSILMGEKFTPSPNACSANEAVGDAGTHHCAP